MGLFDFLKRKAPKTLDDPLVAEFGPLAPRLFPRGEADISPGVEQIRQITKGALPERLCRRLAVLTKAFYSMSPDPTMEKVIDYIISIAEHKVTSEQAGLVWQWLVGNERERYSGGKGNSIDDAVVITAPSSVVGVRAEYGYLERRFGPRTNWHIEKRVHGTVGARVFETFVLRSQSQEPLGAVVFDITSFFGKP